MTMNAKKRFHWLYVDPLRLGKRFGKKEKTTTSKSGSNVQAETCSNISSVETSTKQTTQIHGVKGGNREKVAGKSFAKTEINSTASKDKNGKVQQDNRTQMFGTDWRKNVAECTRIHSDTDKSVGYGIKKTGNIDNSTNMDTNHIPYNRSRSLDAKPVSYNQSEFSVNRDNVQGVQQRKSTDGRIQSVSPIMMMTNNDKTIGYSDKEIIAINSNPKSLYDNRARQNISRRQFYDRKDHQPDGSLDNSMDSSDKVPINRTVSNIRFDSSDYDTLDDLGSPSNNKDNLNSTLVITNENLVKKYEEQCPNNTTVKSYSCQNLLPSFTSKCDDRRQSTRRMISAMDSSSEDIDEQSSSEYVEYFIRCNGTVIKQKNSSTKICGSDSGLNHEHSNHITPASFEYKSNNGYANHNGAAASAHAETVSLGGIQNRSLKSRKLKSLFKSRSKEKKLEKHISWGTVNEHFDEYPYPPKVRQLEQKTFTESANNSLIPKKSMSLNLSPGFEIDRVMYDPHYNLESPSSIGSASSLIESDSQADIYGSSSSSTLSNHSCGVDHQDISGCHVSSSLSHLPPNAQSYQGTQRDTKSELDLVEIMSTFSDILNVPSLDYQKTKRDMSYTGKHSNLKPAASFGCQKDLQERTFRTERMNFPYSNKDKYNQNVNIKSNVNGDLFSQEFECSLTELQSELMRSDSTDTLTEDSFAELEQQSSELQKSISLLEDLDTFSSSQKQSQVSSAEPSNMKVSSPHQNKSQSCYDLVFSSKQNRSEQNINTNKKLVQNTESKNSDILQKQQMKHAVSHNVVHNYPQSTKEPLNSWVSLQEVLKELDPSYEADNTSNLSPKSNEGQSQIKSEGFLNSENIKNDAMSIKSNQREMIHLNREPHVSDYNSTKDISSLQRGNRKIGYHKVGVIPFERDNVRDNGGKYTGTSIYGQNVQNKVTNMTMVDGKIMGPLSSSGNKQNGSCLSLPAQSMTDYCSRQLQLNPLFGSDYQLKREESKQNKSSMSKNHAEIRYSNSSQLNDSDGEMFNSSSSTDCSSVASSSLSEISHKEQLEFEILLKNLGCDDLVDLNSNNSNNNIDEQSTSSVGKFSTLPALKTDRVNHVLIKYDLVPETKSLGTKQGIKISAETRSSSQVSVPDVMQCSIKSQQPPSWKFNNDFNSAVLHNNKVKVGHDRKNINSVVSVRKTVTVINSETIEQIQSKGDSIDLDSEGNKLELKTENVTSSHKFTRLNDNSVIDEVNNDSCLESSQSTVDVTLKGKDEAFKLKPNRQDSHYSVSLKSDKSVQKASEKAIEEDIGAKDGNLSLERHCKDNKIVKGPLQKSGNSDIHNLLELSPFQLVELSDIKKVNSKHGPNTRENINSSTIQHCDSSSSLSDSSDSTVKSLEFLSINSSHREKVTKGSKGKSGPFKVTDKTVQDIVKVPKQSKMASLGDIDSSADMIYDNFKTSSQNVPGVQPRIRSINKGKLSSTPYSSKQKSDYSQYRIENTAKLDSILESLNEFINEPLEYEKQQGKSKYVSSNIPRTWSTHSMCVDMGHNMARSGMEYPLIRSTSFGDGVYESVDHSHYNENFSKTTVPRSSTVIGLTNNQWETNQDIPVEEEQIYEGISVFQKELYTQSNARSNSDMVLPYPFKSDRNVKPPALEDLISSLHDIDKGDKQLEGLNMNKVSQSCQMIPNDKYCDLNRSNITTTKTHYSDKYGNIRSYPHGESDLSNRAKICESRNVPINLGHHGNNVHYGDNVRFISSSPSSPYDDPLLQSNNKMVSNCPEVTTVKNKATDKSEVVYEEIPFNETQDYVELKDGHHGPKRPTSFTGLKDTINVVDSHHHTFIEKSFKKPRNCDLCNQHIWNTAQVCRVCKYVCHRKCETQVMSQCVPPVNYELPRGHESINRQSSSATPSTPTRGGISKGMMSSLKSKMSKGREEGLCEMDLTYITERIIVMSFVSDSNEGLYRSSLREVTQMLKNKHGDNYMIVNLSEHRNDIEKTNPKVLDFGWPDHLSPPLERLCSICKSIDSWLNSDPRNVVVLHCRGGRGRMAVVIAAYMNYTSICASADSALDRFAMKRFYDDKLCDTTQPSQSRYVHYFAGLLSGAIKINSNPLFLHHMIMNGITNFDGRGGCRPFIKVYQGMQPVFVSPVYTAPENSQQLCLSLEPSVQLRGDILIKCYNKRMRSASRELIFRVQFHTCAISDNLLVFHKHELDEACSDVRFPENARVEFLFSQGAEKVRADHLSVSFAQPVETTGNLERWDSYEDFNNLSQDLSSLEENGAPVEGRVRVMHVQHTEGPLDGSLYATVTKSREELRREQQLKQQQPHHFSSSSTTTSSTRSQQYHHSETSNKHSNHSFSDVSYTHPPLLSKQSTHTFTNGPLDQSADSGISSPLSGYNTGSQTHQPTTHNNMASTMISTQQTLPNSNMALRNKNLDEHSQLDDIISELLGEPVKSDRTFIQPKGQQISPTHGSLTTQSGNSRTIVSWETSNAGPAKSATVSKHTVSKPSPNAQSESFQTVHKEEFSYSSDIPQKSSSTLLNSSPSKTMPRLPPNAFSYGSVQENRQFHENFSSETKRDGMKSPTPPPRDSSRGRVTSPIFRDRVDSPTIRNRIGSPILGSSPPSSKVNSVPYRVDYENQDAGRGYYSDSEHSMSWLQQQQMKLQAKREGRGVDHRTKRERQLVTELKNAQTTLQRQRAESESHERDIMEQYSKQDTDVFMANGPSYAIKTSPDEKYRRPFSPSSLQRSASAMDHSDYKTEKKFYVSGVERPPFTTHQTKYTFSVSPPNKSDGAIKNKPPPSPGQFGRSAPTSPIIPQRGVSNQSAAQQRSRSVTREWQTQGRPVMRQLSFDSYDSATLPQTRSKYYMQTSPIATLPRTRSKSPAQLYSAQTIEYSPRHHKGVQRSATLPRNFRQNFKPIRSEDFTEEVESHREEIFVRRPVVANTGYNSNLDELERSLQSALQTAPKYEEDKRQTSGSFGSESRFTESSFESRQQNTFRSITPEWDKREQLAPPAPEPEVEEEVISLQPIGPGLQNLEPEGTGTLGRGARSPTPQFPVQAEETPPFPVSPLSPKTPYDNKVYKQSASVQHNQSLPRADSGTLTKQANRASVEKLIESQMVVAEPLQAPPPLLTGFRDQPLSQSSPVQRNAQDRNVVTGVRISDPTYATIPDDLSLDMQPVIEHPAMTRSFESQQYEVHSYNQQPPPLQQPVVQPVQPQPRVVSPLHSGFTESRFERHEVHGQQVPQQPISYQQNQQQQQQHMLQQHENMQQANTLQRMKTPTYTGSGTIGRSGYDTMSPFPDQDQAYNVEARTMERSYTMPSSNVGGGLKSSASTSQVHDGGTQTLERSYSTGNAAQFAQQVHNMTPATPDSVFTASPSSPRSPYDYRVPMTPPFPKVQRSQMTPYDNRAATLQPSSQSHMVSHQSMSSQGGTGQQQHVQYTHGTLQPSGQSSHQGVPEVTAGGTQIIREYQETVQRAYTPGAPVGVQITPGAPVSQEEMMRITQQQQQQSAMQNQSGSFHQSGGDFQQSSGTAFQQSPGTAFHQSTGAGFQQSGGGFNQSSGFQQHQSVGSYQSSGGYTQQGMQNGGGQMGTLSVDTSMRSMGSSGYQRSPGSQSSDGISPGSHMQTLTSQSHTLRSQVSGGRITPGAHSVTGQSSPGYMGHSRKGSFSSLDGSDIVHHTPKFVRDTSKLWYKPHISRDEAISLLKDRCAGSFVVRDSNSFPGAFGLALKVAHIPPNVPTKGDPQTELVRHFLIEPTSKGVKLKGCSNEPVFASLAALVYQHSITPLALPCKLLLPETTEVGPDITDGGGTLTSSSLLAQGAACNVLFLHTADMESLTGPEAVAKAIKELLSKKPANKTTVVHFKVSSQGITLTDNKRRLFFRRHYPVTAVTFCGMDPEDRKWTQNNEDTGLPMSSKIFGFVARKSGGSSENQCHLFAELDPDQPASAIVNFVTKVMIGQGRIMKT